jgi:NCS1 family nucleobase:cation symporter-1
MGSGFAVLISLVALSVATLSTNLAANVVSPANAMVNMSPQRISFRTGSMITAGLGVAIFPWKLIESSSGYIFAWLIGYSALLGPIGGILLVDYYLLRRMELNLEGLYRHDGPYGYRSGYNWVAFVALLIGVAPNVPGFLEVAGLVAEVPEVFSTIYTYAWFVGLPLAGGVYWLLSRLTARGVNGDAVE